MNRSTPRSRPRATTPWPDATRPEEVVRRKKAVEKALQSVLTREQIAHAILLCDHEFATEPAFSATSFCQRLVETLPEIQLNAQARLALLRTVRQSAEELGVENVTSLVGVPRQFLQAVAPEDALPPKIVNRTDTPSKSEPEPSAGLRLEGHYWASLDDSPTGEMVVTALSLSGLTFEIQIAQPVRDGQHVSVAFQVEPADKSRVWQSGVVRSVSGNRVEATWHNPETLDTILLRYLTTE